MKKYILILISFIISCQLQAQDTIITDEGDIITAYSLEESPTSFFYKENDKKSAPFKRVEKESVLMIKYKDGTVERFNVSDDDSKDKKKKATAQKKKKTKVLVVDDDDEEEDVDEDEDEDYEELLAIARAKAKAKAAKNSSAKTTTRNDSKTVATAKSKSKSRRQVYEEEEEIEEVPDYLDLSNFQGFLLDKGNNVYIPLDGPTDYERAGAKQLKKNMEKDKFWNVVDSEDMAHFVLEYLVDTERNRAYLLIRDREGERTVDSRKINYYYSVATNTTPYDNYQSSDKLYYWFTGIKTKEIGKIPYDKAGRNSFYKIILSEKPIKELKEFYF